MLRHRVKTLAKRADTVHPPPLPPDQIKQFVLPHNDRDEPPPGRYRISPCCDLIILPPDCVDDAADDAADDALAEGRPCG